MTDSPQKSKHQGIPFFAESETDQNQGEKEVSVDELAEIFVMKLDMKNAMIRKMPSLEKYQVV